MPASAIPFDIEDGLSQSERSLQALDPDYARPDDRSPEDLLRQAVAFAGMINYYGFNDQPDGTWEAFFDSDVDVLVNILSEATLNTAVLRYESLISELQLSESNRQSAALLQEIFTLCAGLLAPLLKFVDRLSLAKNRHVGTAALRRLLRNANDLRAQFAMMVEDAKTTIPELAIPQELAGLLQIAAAGPARAAASGGTDLHQNRLRPIAAAVNVLFAALKLRYGLLIDASVRYVGQLKPDGDIYDPHMGLFMAFAHLFGYLQKSLNRLPEKHLNYYYKNLLQLEHRPAEPDKTWLVLQPMPGAAPVVVPAGEQFQAALPGKPLPDIFEWKRTMAITDAAVAKLATSYLSPDYNTSGYSGDAKDVERNFYISSIPVVGVAAFLKSERNKAWPLMGEEQATKPVNTRTMEDAGVGLIIGSPLLYLQDGVRTIHVRFFFSAETAAGMEQYLKDAAENAGYNEFAITQRMFRNAFHIYLTTAEEWTEVAGFNVRHNLSGTSPSIDLSMVLGAEEPAVVAYQKDAHGGEYRLDLPAMKLVINTASFHNPLGLLLNAGLERITLSARVSGAAQFSIRNNFGPLSATMPFQPFGPIPAVGSFLDVIAPAAFNRFTDSFRLNINWLDLPREEGGFESYYKEYRTDVTNDSFKARIASYNGGKIKPAPEQQDRVHLFDSYRDDNMQVYLRDTAAIPYSQPRKLDFSNDAAPSSLFDQDGLHGGVLRLQLSDPPDAFGQKLYPILFPEVLTHNARRFSFNRKIPNPPYVPMVNRMTIDYSLSHTEALRHGVTDTDDGALRLIHLGPFGYQDVYPGNAAQVTLLPEIPEGNNLYVGLKDLAPGQEISLLFLLEEVNFTHTLQALDRVEWSYFQQNRWWPIAEIDILEDNTNSFTRSGTIIFRLRTDLSTAGNSLMQPDVFWLRAAVPGGNIAHSKALAVFAQGGEVLRSNKAPQESGALQHLPAGAIDAPRAKLPGIAAVYQPAATTGGADAETDQSFRVRVSERLRHKGYPLTTLDISQIILEHFPQIMMVRCFNGLDSDALVIPDINVQIIVIPRNAVSCALQGLEPKVNLSTLLSIKAFINDRLSCFALAEVGNPVYEQVKVVCTIRLRNDDKSPRNGQVASEINDDIRRFITPWLYDGSEAVQIGSRIYVAQVMNYIQTLPYVEAVTNFSVLHFYRRYDPLTGQEKSFMTDTAINNLSYIQASRPDAILMSVARNIITIEGKEAGALRPSGIGALVVGSELTVTAQRDTVESLLPALVAGRARDAEDQFNFSLNV